MTTWIVRVITNALALAFAAWLFTGISVNGHSQGDRILTVVVVALIFGIINEFVRPIVAILSLPLYLLTLGLFFFVVNALMLLLTSWIAGQLSIGFHVDGFWTAVLGSIVITVVSWLIGLVSPRTN
ncbi:MAG: phage holin family protein [Nocardioidaceae bacterium]